MGNTEKEFFEGKRHWSKMKDQILCNYLPVYFKKVNKLLRPIIVVDSFAGPGKYADGTTGSPLQICSIANTFVPDNYTAILGNQSKEHHHILKEAISEKGYSKNVFCVKNRANSLLSKLVDLLRDETLLVYLDPFGLKGTDFSIIEKIISRPKSMSTEIIINLSAQTICRLSAFRSVQGEPVSAMIEAKRRLLTNALGGDYWKQYFFNDTLSTKEKLEMTMREYLRKIRKHLDVVNACPVFETTENSRLKYFIIFASRHFDSALLMNDIMFTAFQGHRWESLTIGTLFENRSWQTELPQQYFIEIEKIILNILASGKMSRKELWTRIIKKKFMLYHHTDFYNILRKLIFEKKKLDFVDVRHTGKLNDDSIIYIKE